MSTGSLTALTIAVALSVLVDLPAVAEVSLNALVSDNMVLQRGMEAPIWGKAEPGERVTVSLGGQSEPTTADGAGRWMVRLPAMDAGGPFELTVTGNSSEIRVHNIMCGDVWVCCGQSNMAMPMSRSLGAEQHIAQANYPDLRLFIVERAGAEEPLEDLKGNWAECSPETVRAFSATAYFFGRELHEELRVPIGLIGTYWGKSPAQAWTKRAVLEADRDLAVVLDDWQTYMTERYPKLMEQYPARLAAWEEKIAEAKARGVAAPIRPPEPAGSTSRRAPGALYNAMIAPLIPYAIKGAIWYQGEANRSQAYQYRKLFPAMITSWREDWGQGDFPFLWVQLPNFRPIQAEPGESMWAELREAQLRTLSLPNTGMAITIELGEADDIHPRNKPPVGQRLALSALAKVYGRDLVHSGPVYRSMTVRGNKAYISFTHVDGGLVRRVTENAPYPSPLTGFAVAGRDRRFVWADAAIQPARGTVAVWSDDVPHPAAVRYAWADNPVCNLFNRAGLPASPFRTDSWPGLTQPRPDSRKP